MRTAVSRSIILVVYLIVATGCGGAGRTSVNTIPHTPTGVPCHEFDDDPTHYCYYYIKDGVPTACSNVTLFNYCEGTSGGFYMYVPYLHNTYYCDAGSHNGCSPINNPSVTDPTVLCPAPKITYDNLVNKTQAWKVVDEEQDQNNTTGPVQVTFTSSKSSTITISASVNVKTYASVTYLTIFASVQAEVNASVVSSATTVVGNSYSFMLPPNRTAYGIYGVRVQVTTGHLFSTESYSRAPCRVLAVDYGSVTTYVPIAPGWCVWINTEPPCLIAP